MRDICAFNMLSADHLSRPIDGMTLRQWIEQGERGTLTPFRDFWVWEPPRDQIDMLRDVLEAAGVLLPMAAPDGFAPDMQATPASHDFSGVSLASVDKDKRDALVARMTAAAPRAPAVPIDVFFDGNDDPASFWCNLAEPVPMSKARTVLEKIKRRPEVHDVRIVPKQFDGGDNEWPFSDTILVVTSVDAKTLRKWLGRKYAPDEVDAAASQADLDVVADFEPLTIPPGMHVLIAWWD
jgi:hypothetical protein